ncbi:MAG: cytochrome c biogenesis CcdA family protein [Bacillota bacterium]
MSFIPFNFSLAFTAGMLAAFNPCGVVMLPTYIAYLFTQPPESNKSKYIIRTGLKFGMTMTLGFLTIFIITGIAISILGNYIINLTPQLAIFIGFLFIILGIWLLINPDNKISSSLLSRLGGKIKQKHYLNLYFYGIGYAIVSLGCTLPVFMIAIFTSFTSSNFTQGILNFILYGTGMGIVVTVITIFSLLAKNVVEKWIKKLIPYINITAAIFILFTGFYLIYYWTIGPGNL